VAGPTHLPGRIGGFPAGSTPDPLDDAVTFRREERGGKNEGDGFGTKAPTIKGGRFAGESGRSKQWGTALPHLVNVFFRMVMKLGGSTGLSRGTKAHGCNGERWEEGLDDGEGGPTYWLPVRKRFANLCPTGPPTMAVSWVAESQNVTSALAAFVLVKQGFYNPQGSEGNFRRRCSGQPGFKTG